LEVLDPNPLTDELSFAEHQPRCPECGTERHEKDYNRAEIVCSCCGLVIEDKILGPGREWRGVTREEIMARERGGPPTTYRIYDKGLSTVIDPTNYDARGRALGPKTMRIVSRLRRWDRRTRSRSVNRNLVYCTVFGFPQSRD
jgi:transcription initiation factor TFIIB